MKLLPGIQGRVTLPSGIKKRFFAGIAALLALMTGGVNVAAKDAKDVKELPKKSDSTTNIKKANDEIEKEQIALAERLAFGLPEMVPAPTAVTLAEVAKETSSYAELAKKAFTLAEKEVSVKKKAHSYVKEAVDTAKKAASNAEDYAEAVMIALQKGDLTNAISNRDRAYQKAVTAYNELVKAQLQVSVKIGETTTYISSGSSSHSSTGDSSTKPIPDPKPEKPKDPIKPGIDGDGQNDSNAHPDQDPNVPMEDGTVDGPLHEDVPMETSVITNGQTPVANLFIWGLEGNQKGGVVFLNKVSERQTKPVSETRKFIAGQSLTTETQKKLVKTYGKGIRM